MSNILDLDPLAFAAALDELGLPAEEQTRLRQLYQQKSSPLAGVKEAVAPEEGRNTSDYLPVSVPEGQSIAEGLTSGNWDWAVPEGLSSAVTTAAEGVEAPGQILSGVPYSQQEMQEAAWKTVGTAVGGSLAAPVPDGATRMFGGMRARNFPWDRYDAMDAKEFELQMQGKKLDPAIAWEDYGIEVGEEGPVFQIDPAGAKTRSPFTVEKKLDQMLKDYKHAAFDMDEVLDFPELFENYPVLKDFKVTVRSEKNGEPLSRGGWFDAQNGEVVVGPESARNPEEFRQVLLHELQHGIQAVENTSGGASTSYFFRQNPDTGVFETDLPELRANVKKLNTIRDRVIDAEVNYGTESQTYREEWQDFVSNYEYLSRLAWKKYLTNSGEVEARAAELWDQLSPEEKKTTTPSEIKKQALGLLKKEYGDTDMPTARLSNRYAEGGMVQGTNMENDMTKLFAEGGINTGDAKVDPVSGNEVPPGSLPEEVRDDVDAKLSGGEYVVPADVLRFYGVKFFEQLRRKAKEGLAEMDAEGRIGGDSEEAPEMPEEEEEEDLPFGEDELMFEDDGEEMEFNAGGVVPPGGIKTFDPNQFYAGFSVFGDQPVQTPVAPPAPVPAPAPVRTAEPTPRPQESWADRQTTSPSAGNSQTRQNANKTPDWATGKNWSGMTPEEATQLASERLAGNKLLSAGAQLAGVVNPFLGIAAGAAVNLRPYAEANAIEKVLRAQGNTAAADAVAKMTDDKLADAKLGTRTLEPLLANGSMIARNIMGATQTSATRSGVKAATAPTRKLTTSSQNSGSSSGAEKSKSSSSSGTGAKKGVVGSGTTSTTKSTSSTSKPSTTSSSKTSSRSTGGSSASNRSGGRYKEGGLVKRRMK